MDQEYSSGETGASARIRPIPIFRIVFIVDLMISMFSIVIIGFYSYLWYIVEIAAIMAVYTAGAVAHFNLYTRKQNPRRKFSHFYGRGLSAAIPALIITTTDLLFHLHIITGIREGAIILLIISNILFALSILFPFVRQWRIERGKDRTLTRVKDWSLEPLQTRLRAVRCGEPLLYVKNLRGRKIANASQVGITRPVIIMTDFLYENMMETHLSAILGHEMGHFVNRDAFRSILLFTVPAFLALDSFLYAMVDPSTIWFIVLAAFSVFEVVDLLLIFPWSRRRSEFNADRFVGKKLQLAGDMVSALEALVTINGRPPEYRFFSSRTHPSIEQRMRVLEEH